MATAAKVAVIPAEGWRIGEALSWYASLSARGCPADDAEGAFDEDNLSYLDPEYDDRLGEWPESGAERALRYDLLSGGLRVKGYRPENLEKTIDVPPACWEGLRFDAKNGSVDDGRGLYLVGVRIFRGGGDEVGSSSLSDLGF